MENSKTTIRDLMKASHKGDVEKVIIELDKGLNINAMCKMLKGGCTSLHLASSRNHLNVVRCLVDRGAEIEFTNCHGTTALHCACRTNSVDVVKFLLDKGADINLRNMGGYTPLFVASKFNNMDTVIVLLEQGADPNIKTIIHVSPLTEASRRGNLEIVKLLLEEGTNILSKKGVPSSLCVAYRKNHVNIFREILNYGINSGIDSDRLCSYFLPNAVRSDRVEFIRVALDCGVDIDGLYGVKTLLESASLYNSIDVVRELINRGAKLEGYKKENGRMSITPLMHACRKGHLDIVRELIYHGAKYPKTSLDRLDVEDRMEIDEYIASLPVNVKRALRV